MARHEVGDFRMAGLPATAQEISDYLDDMKAGMDAGPAGTPEFRQAVHENQERRKASLNGLLSLVDGKDGSNA